MRERIARMREIVRTAVTRSNARDAIELVGVGLIVAAAARLNISLGLLVGGVALVIVGNFA